MLNRLYIVVGVLAIIVLAGGFLIPRFVDWSGFRERIEEIAEANLGTEVTIDGDIGFTLLPQPEMRFDHAVVGPLETPVLEIGSVVAQFSLMDFLRDRFSITSLQVTDPAFYVTLDANGQFELPLNLPENFSTANISIESADITGGSLRVSDARTDQSWRLEEFAGQLRISGVSGPFGLQGSGRFDGEPYALRVTTSALGANEQLQVSMFARPASGRFSLSTEGLLQIGADPDFKGQMVYRASPEVAAAADEVRGDLVLSGDVDLTTHKLLLSAFTFFPDENQASTRLTGAAVLDLGAQSQFDVVLSGGVVGLAPRDARDPNASSPYELIRLLTDLPPIMVPSIPGRIGVDIGELNLRAFSVRNVRLDAATNGASWRLETFIGQLPGASEVRLSGEFRNEDDRLAYNGQLSLRSSRLDALAQMWRTPEASSPLFNMSGELLVDMSLSDGELGLANGVLTLDDEAHQFASLLTLEGDRGALLSARLGELSPRQSRAILALLPDFWGDESFGVTFPNGSIDIAAERATVMDIEGEGLGATFDWSPAGLHVERLSTRNWGGARLNLSGDIRGTLSAPVVSGGGTVFLPFGQDQFAIRMLDRLGADPAVADWFLRSLPLDAELDVTPVDDAGAQVVSLNGRAGVAEVTASANLSAGLVRALGAPMVLEARFSAEKPEEFADQLGMGLSPLPSDEPVVLNVQLGGAASNSFQTTLSAVSGPERLGFAGTLIVSDLLELRGNGQLDFGLTDPGPLLALFGVDALALPGITGTSSLSFTGNNTLAFNNFDVRTANGPGLAGTLGLAVTSESRLVTGQVYVDELEVSQLWGVLAGPASLLSGDDIWPDGPIDLSPGNRNSRGRINVSAPWLKAGNRAVLSDVAMVLNWNETQTGLQNFVGHSTGGTVEASLDLCCAGLAADKQATGRLSVEGVDLHALLPDGSAAALSGRLDGGLQFVGNGASLNEIVGSLSGEGSFSVHELEVARFDPGVFAALAEMEDVSDLDAATMSAIVAQALASGPLEVGELGGIFRIAAGTARADNLAAQGSGGRLLGNLDVELQALELNGAFTLTPTQSFDPEGLISSNTAQVTADITGTLLEPTRDLDVGEMVDAIQARALELEVRRLEKLQAEEEARQRAAAAERARLMEEEAQRLAEEAMRKAAEEEAQRLRDEIEAQRLRDELARQQVLEPPVDLGFESQDPFVINNQNLF